MPPKHTERQTLLRTDNPKWRINTNGEDYHYDRGNEDVDGSGSREKDNNFKTDRDVPVMRVR